MEVKNIMKFLEDKTILVTGGTGFLAKVLVEKILRVQPNLRKLYLLIRANNQDEAINRFHMEVAGSNLFRILQEKYGENMHTFLSEKVFPVAGDITNENMGVRDYNLIEEMQRQVDVIVNSAATTKFYERYDVALNINTLGAKHVSNFALKCSNMKMFLHISTDNGNSFKITSFSLCLCKMEGLILEKPHIYGESLNGKATVNIEKEKQLIEERLKQLATEKATNQEIASSMKDLGLKRAKHHGWPNTYVFTKAMGEMLFGELSEDVPLIILRPSIVGSTYKEPFPGWIEGVRTMDTVCVGYIKGTVTCIRGDPDCIMDIIPADMVVNAIIVAMAAHVNHPNSKIIYHVTSSASNPFKLQQIVDWSIQYFAKHPYINEDGSIRAHKFELLSSLTSFRRYMAIHYELPLQGLKIVNMLLCHALDGLCTDFSRKLQTGTLYTDLFCHYTLSKAIYDDFNLKSLLNIYKETPDDGTQMFFFDPSSINWEDYYMNKHLPGLVKYAIE